MIKKGKIKFVGIGFTNKKGEQKLLKPCKKVKIEVEKHLNYGKN